MKPLLAVDGDSFAHRAFHALPRSFRRDDGGPANTLIGFMSMLLRLWQAERPRAVVVGWDTLFVPTYRNELLATYQSGREFDPEIVDQLALLPALVSSTGIVCGKQAGFEADDFLAAAVAAERARGGTTLVATSDRDAFQLAAADVTILQPVRGVSELQRIGPAEVRERYGVEPEQVCDFIALRGDPSDKIPGARGVGEKTAAVAPADSTPIWRRCSTPGGSRRRRSSSAPSGRSRRSTRRRRCPTFPTSSPTGLPALGLPRSSASSGSRRGCREV